ncbi:uncharacterized protein LAESUDRAFT_724412 [Laetiporus sulphureus 93-53]|uniref:Uncharacterized protein n=1 Tax=Laetiporus sulphureus 93-53 TaxID=1314785 RepID=A0A165EXN9_9APHY|nr:uncharacterized protein LAESUDRAFT_724412 [Laetiporus sulphureus 93-53]KZT07934.1 hypothetical protein LAESUDRAFT_724412 [Laetiporus sulphureus 93-53]
MAQQPKPSYQRANFAAILDGNWEISSLGAMQSITKKHEDASAEESFLDMDDNFYEVDEPCIVHPETIDMSLRSDEGEDASQQKIGKEISFEEFEQIHAITWQRLFWDHYEERKGMVDYSLYEDTKPNVEDTSKAKATVISEDDDDEMAPVFLPKDLLSDLGAEDIVGKYDVMAGGHHELEALPSDQKMSTDFHLDTILNPIWVDSAKVGVPQGSWPTFNKSNASERRLPVSNNAWTSGWSDIPQPPRREQPVKPNVSVMQSKWLGVTTFGSSIWSSCSSASGWDNAPVAAPAHSVDSPRDQSSSPASSISSLLSSSAPSIPSPRSLSPILSDGALKALPSIEPGSKSYRSFEDEIGEIMFDCL